MIGRRHRRWVGMALGLALGLGPARTHEAAGPAESGWELGVRSQKAVTRQSA